MQHDACKYDLEIKCVNDTGCTQCIQSENEWAAKWIQYVHGDSSVNIGKEIPSIELEN